MSSWIRLGLSSREAYLNFFRRFPPLVEFLCLGTLTGLILFPLPGIQVVLLFTVSRLLCLLDVPVHWTHFLTRVWAFGFGFFCISLYWICQALFIEFNVFWWMIPLCFMGLPAFLALFMAFISFWFLGWAYTVPSKILQFLFLQFEVRVSVDYGSLLVGVRRVFFDIFFDRTSLVSDWVYLVASAHRGADSVYWECLHS